MNPIYLFLSSTAFYVGSYFALVEKVTLGELPTARHSTWLISHAEYRGGNPVLKPVFAPVHWLDRQVRRDYWAARPLSLGRTRLKASDIFAEKEVAGATAQAPVAQTPVADARGSRR